MRNLAPLTSLIIQPLKCSRTKPGQGQSAQLLQRVGLGRRCLVARILCPPTQMTRATGDMSQRMSLGWPRQHKQHGCPLVVRHGLQTMLQHDMLAAPGGLQKFTSDILIWRPKGVIYFVQYVGKLAYGWIRGNRLPMQLLIAKVCAGTASQVSLAEGIVRRELSPGMEIKSSQVE